MLISLQDGPEAQGVQDTSAPNPRGAPRVPCPLTCSRAQVSFLSESNQTPARSPVSRGQAQMSSAETLSPRRWRHSAYTSA